MPAPTDHNARIVLAKGWTWHKHDFFLAPDFGNVPELRTHWLDSQGEPAMLPDFASTLKGVAGMMRELIRHAKAHDEYWVWGYDDDAWPNHDYDRCYYCAKQGLSIHKSQPLPVFLSPEDRPGHCVGDAYLSVFGKEATDES